MSMEAMSHAMGAAVNKVVPWVLLKAHSKHIVAMAIAPTAQHAANTLSSSSSGVSPGALLGRT
jgi:hypothetical protein